MTGSYLLFQQRMRIDTKVVRVADGEVVAGESVEGKEGEFFALEKELVEILTRALPVKLGISEKSALRKSQTESLRAFQQYSRGLDAADAGDDAKARAAFQKALEADPGFRAATAALGRLRADIAGFEKARAETFEAELEALEPADPDFGRIAKRLYDSGGRRPGTNLERELRQRKMLEFLARKGYRPFEEISYQRAIGDSQRRYLEVDQLLSLAGVFGDEAEVLDATPLVLQYLLDVYPDDADMYLQIDRCAARLERALAGRKASPERYRPKRRTGEQKIRADATYALFEAIATLGAQATRGEGSRR